MTSESAASVPPSVINIARDFSRTPGGRYYTDGPASGQQFRDEALVPALRHHKRITIEMDGARGYPSSFLEEAFGGLVRERILRPEEVFKRIDFRASGAFQIYIEDIKEHVKRQTLALGS